MSDKRYYDRTQGAPAWPALLMALDASTRTTGFAIDLGCGAGRDTLELLRRGWEVLAIDREKQAIARLCQQLQTDQAPRLQTLCEHFEHCELPPADLINSAFALPFCHPKEFPHLWQRISHALKHDGLFCGNFFGPDDDWASADLSILDKQSVENLFAGWELLHFEEINRQGSTARGHTKHWHLFSVVARRKYAR
ncbi:MULTISPECIES: trans-aconitate 2-methyltransferase [Pseudomonas]|jgi:SAM-dependent methyltransferase|uniref:class I SAM-dependent methyltransferase n=1 Tax=Pseudomonadaceae TaxID=135621 RepID=UPI001582B941|nr:MULTISPECIES: class I SAM-dependent methyltransferase [Pseudomonas]QTS87796.1 class I SAM-dependent methyltransferase [Pseudomonas khazarica]